MRITPPDRRQRFLLPPSIDEFVDANHRVRVIVEVVERLDYSDFAVGGGDTGRPAYPAEVLIPLILYAFSVGVFASREMDRRCRTDCAFMYATAGLKPSYRTICRFREQYQDELANVFTQVLLVCRQAGLGDTEIVAIDGTSQRASASMDAHTRQEQLEREIRQIRRQMAQMLEEAARQDAEDDARDDDGGSSGGPPTGLGERQARIDAIEAAIEQLKESGKKEANTTDPDARLQRFKEGTRPGYNAQIGVSGKDGFIVASDVVQTAGDGKMLLPMLQHVCQETGESPGIVVADGGYENSSALKALVERDQDAVLGSMAKRQAYGKRRKSGRFQWVDFKYRIDDDEYICPAGLRLVYRSTSATTGHRMYEGTGCATCRQQSRCTNARARRLRVHPDNAYVQAMSERRNQDRQRGHLLANRKAWVEGPFGHFKHNLRWRQFTRRGLAAARSEFRLLCAAYNLAKLARMLPSPA